MVDRQCQNIAQIEISKSRPRWGSLTNDRGFLNILDQDQQRLQLTSLRLAPVNSNIYARRHSAHTCPIIEDQHASLASLQVPPPIPLRPPAIPKRSQIPPPINTTNITKSTTKNHLQPPPIPPASKSRTLPPIPRVNNKPKPPQRNYTSNEFNNNDNNNSNAIIRRTYDANRNPASKSQNKLSYNTFVYNSTIHDFAKLPPAPIGPPPPAPNTHYKSSISTATTATIIATTTNTTTTTTTTTDTTTVTNTVTTVIPTNRSNIGQQPSGGRISVRQDSSVSSDSFSQTSSPSYTTKTMETPLLPPKTPIKPQNGLLRKVSNVDNDSNSNTTITKSVSTPASLQTVVRFHNGSNMSLHHRIIRDMRRPSSHYARRIKLKFRFAQIIFNAVALFAIGAGMAAYFKAYPSSVQIINATLNTTARIPVVENLNPAPGICLPIIVSFCQQHKVPYNFTVFPNYMGQFGQREAQQELEIYDAVVDVRCYELAALFLCSVFVPKCGPDGGVVRPCRNLCAETKRRCGFFLDVFGLSLPDYLECDLFPDRPDSSLCIGYDEYKQAKMRAQKPVCPTGFQCDKKRCIPKDWQCDGHIDCEDQSDELNCNQCANGMIHCGDDKCITQEHMCDGKVDCPWGQDERNCLRLSDRNGDEGKGQLQVYRPDQKQWVPACVAHWDQKTSPDTICSILGYSNSNGSRLLRGIDINISPPIQETTAIWRMNQNRRPKNMIREFGSCNGTTYPTVDLICSNYMCGKARKSYGEELTLRIVGGVRSKPGDWPFLAALLGGPEEIFYCAGVLIADQWVLTASHCVGNHTDESGWTIQLGITRRHAHSFYGQKMKVKKVVAHPLYNLGVAHDNDVALLKLSSRVAFHEHLLPVCLPSANQQLHPGTVCTVIGWGKKEDTNMSDYEPEVNEVEVPVLNRDLCNSWLENREMNVTDGMICAGYEQGGKDACQGDSGGPLLCRDSKDPEKWFVGGIVSWGIKCAHPHLPGVYAFVPKYIPWILQQMKIHSD